MMKKFYLGFVFFAFWGEGYANEDLSCQETAAFESLPREVKGALVSVKNFWQSCVAENNKILERTDFCDSADINNCDKPGNILLLKRPEKLLESNGMQRVSAHAREYQRLLISEEVQLVDRLSSHFPEKQKLIWSDYKSYLGELFLYKEKMLDLRECNQDKEKFGDLLSEVMYHKEILERVLPGAIESNVQGAARNPSTKNIEGKKNLIDLQENLARELSKGNMATCRYEQTEERYGLGNLQEKFGAVNTGLEAYESVQNSVGEFRPGKNQHQKNLPVTEDFVGGSQLNIIAQNGGDRGAGNSKLGTGDQIEINTESETKICPWYAFWCEKSQEDLTAQSGGKTAQNYISALENREETETRNQERLHRENFLVQNTKFGSGAQIDMMDKQMRYTLELVRSLNESLERILQAVGVVCSRQSAGVSCY